MRRKEKSFGYCSTQRKTCAQWREEGEGESFRNWWNWQSTKERGKEKGRSHLIGLGRRGHGRDGEDGARKPAGMSRAGLKDLFRKAKDRMSQGGSPKGPRKRGLEWWTKTKKVKSKLAREKDSKCDKFPARENDSPCHRGWKGYKCWRQEQIEEEDSENERSGRCGLLLAQAAQQGESHSGRTRKKDKKDRKKRKARRRKRKRREE